MTRFSVVRAFGHAIRVWLRNVVPFTVLTALLHAPVFAWIATRDVDGPLEDVVDPLFGWPILAVIGLSTLLAPMLTYRVVQDLRGVRVPMLTSMRFGVRGFVPAIALAIAVNVLLSFSSIGAVIVTAIVVCVYYVAPPAAVAERVGAWESFGRSSELTQGRRVGIFVLHLVPGLAAFAAMFFWVLPGLEDPGSAIRSDLRTTALIMVGAAVLLQTFTAIVAAVSYALLRQDKEGMSHEELARVFE